MAGTDVSEFLPYVRHLQAEHRKIGQLVEQIQAVYFLNRTCSPETREMGQTARLLQQLGALRSVLRDHFEEEESGGCLEEAISRLPRLAAELGKLETEHRDLLEQLDRIIEIVRAEGFSGPTAEMIERSFNAFAEMLYDHESVENRLLEQGFNVESEHDA